MLQVMQQASCRARICPQVSQIPTPTVFFPTYQVSGTAKT